MNVAVRQISNPDDPVKADGEARAAYLETIHLVERAHRRFLDVVKDELDRLGRTEINNVQAVLLYNLGAEVLTPSELKDRGVYLGSNVSYNLKKLGELGYLEQRRSTSDRRTVRITVTEKGAEVAAIVAGLLDRQMRSLGPIGGIRAGGLEDACDVLRRLDRFWKDQVLYRL